MRTFAEYGIPYLPKFRFYIIIIIKTFSYHKRGIQDADTEKRKRKTETPKRKNIIIERAQQVGPKPAMACAKQHKKTLIENRESPEAGPKPKLA